MAKEIKFNIKLNIDGKEVVGAAVSDVKELRKAWEDSRTAMQKVVGESFKFNQILQGIVVICFQISIFALSQTPLCLMAEVEDEL